jgi:hypothetical protein
MAVQKLSQIAAAPAPPALTDTVIGVGSGTTDYQYTLAQIQAGIISRQVLAADATYYVSTTGSDSNPGTLAAPWATLQHAMNYMASIIDFAGFFVTVIVEAGTYVGFGVKSTIGGGYLRFNGQGPASTTIADGPNDGVYNFGESVSVYIICSTVIALDNVTFTSATGTSTINIASTGIGRATVFLGSPNPADVSNITFGSFTYYAVYMGGSGSVFQDWWNNFPNITVTSGASWFYASFGSTLFGVEANLYTFIGTPNYSQEFVFCSLSAQMYFNTGFSGAATGKRFNVTDNAVIDTGGSGLTFLPGSIAGAIKNGGVYN